MPAPNYSESSPQKQVQYQESCYLAGWLRNYASRQVYLSDKANWNSRLDKVVRSDQQRRQVLYDRIDPASCHWVNRHVWRQLSGLHHKCVGIAAEKGKVCNWVRVLPKRIPNSK